MMPVILAIKKSSRALIKTTTKVHLSLLGLPWKSACKYLNLTYCMRGLVKLESLIWEFFSKHIQLLFNYMTTDGII